MSIEEYLEALKKLVEAYPEIAQYKAVYAKDDEGNGFREVYYGPTIGFLDENNEFISMSSIDEHMLDEDCNAVCLN